MARRHLDTLLLEGNVIDGRQLDACREYARSHGVGFAEAALATKVVHDAAQLADFIATRIQSGLLKISELDIPDSTLAAVPPEVAAQHKVIPVYRDKRNVVVAMADVRTLPVLEAVKFKLGCNLKPIVAPAEDIEKAIKDNYVPDAGTGDFMEGIGEAELEVVSRDRDEAADVSAAVEEAPVAKMVQRMILGAIGRRASDIHVEVYEKDMRVRYRIDGRLVEVAALPYRLRAAVVSRIKVMAEMDISKTLIPQDGSFTLKLPTGDVEIRVSTLPTVFGEKVVMRVLNKSSSLLDIKALGIPEPGLTHLLTALRSPYGMVLVTGPTGGGKSTTLNAALQMLNRPEVNIMTVEDPVEYNIKGINQVQVNVAAGMTFASALRAFLRQDPNIIMVGEIRDNETCEIALKAALTGHLVLSTLHTNDAVGTVARLLDMEVEPYMLASALRVIVAQRLVGTICQECKEAVKMDPKELEVSLGVRIDRQGPVTLYRGKGCDRCNKTGYSGRVGLYEVLPITTEIRELISKRAPAGEITKAGLAAGMKPLRQAGLEKLGAGITTVDEVIRATAE